MKASVVEMRTRMKEILQALRRRESVDILYHGKVAGTIIPVRNERPKKSLRSHPFFGMFKDRYKNRSVENLMDELRGGRYRDL